MGNLLPIFPSITIQNSILTLALLRLCLDNSLDAALVKGKIVLCEGYSSPSLVGFASGAGGLIFTSTLPLVVADVFALPAIHITLSDGKSVYSYLKSTRYKTFHHFIKDHT